MTSFSTAWMLVILSLLNIFVCISAAEPKTTYKLVMDNLTKVLAEEDVVQINLIIDKQGDNAKVSGEVKQLVELDNDWRVNIVALHADAVDGEYTNYVTLPEKGVCDFMKTYYKLRFYETLKDHANAPDPQTCPLPKDVYTVREYPVDLSKMVKFLKPGFYRIVGTLLKAGEEKLKYIVECHAQEDK